MMNQIKMNLSIATIVLAQSSLFAVANQQEGALNITNQSTCAYTLHIDGFNEDSNYISIEEGSDSSNYTIKYNEAINGSRSYQIPVTIKCDITSHVDSINLTLRNRGVTVSHNESKSFAQAKLQLSGETRLDRDNSAVTFMILPTATSGFTAE